MNKKILSIFVMIMALSLFGVSCSSNSTDPNKKNDGGTTTTKTKVTKANLLEAVKKADGVTVKTSAAGGSTTVKFSGINDWDASTTTQSLVVKMKGGVGNGNVGSSETVSRTEAVNSIKTVLEDSVLTSLNVKVSTCEVDGNAGDNDKTATINLVFTVTDASKYEFDTDANNGKVVIKLDLTDQINSQAVTFIK